jgi:hypothetical protein
MLHPLVFPAAGRWTDPPRMDFLFPMTPLPRNAAALEKNNKTAAFKQPLKTGTPRPAARKGVVRRAAPC